MLLVRLRSEGKDGKALAQMVYETFQDNVEARVRAEGVKVSCDSVFCVTPHLTNLMPAQAGHRFMHCDTDHPYSHTQSPAMLHYLQ